MFKKFVKDFSELTEGEKRRINKELTIMGAESLVRQLVDAAYHMVIYDRQKNREKWPQNSGRYKELIKKVIVKANLKLVAGKNRIK